MKQYFYNISFPEIRDDSKETLRIAFLIQVSTSGEVLYCQAIAPENMLQQKKRDPLTGLFFVFIRC